MPDGRGTPGSYARLAEDVLDVVAGGLRGDPEGLGDLLVGLSGEREQDIVLAVGEASGQLAWPRGHAVSGRGEYGVDRLRAQTALTRFAQQLGLGAGSVQCGAMRASLSHRLIGVGGGEDPRRPPARRWTKVRGRGRMSAR